MKYVVLSILAVALAGCSGGLASVVKNRDCTTKVRGDVAFGSITPTGKVSFSAVCKPGEKPLAEDVPDAAPVK